MKIAFLADIHGNSIAVDHVLQDIASQGGVDEYWLLGAYAAIGYALLGVLRWITGLPNARLIHGNTDRYLLTGELPWRFQDGLNDPTPAKA
jgi:predicted phosphodiesterase